MIFVHPCTPTEAWFSCEVRMNYCEWYQWSKFKLVIGVTFWNCQAMFPFTHQSLTSIRVWCDTLHCRRNHEVNLQNGLSPQGVIVGLTGIVTSPLHGAQEEGLKGFFKGIGKGILGVVTKPFGGIADGMTIVLEGIERATDLNEMPVVRRRIPRFISPTQVRR